MNELPLPALPGAKQFSLTTRDGSAYRLLVALPPQPAPPSGHPVMVLVDGHALFATAATSARLQCSRPEVTGVPPAVILGIGYPGEAPFDTERRAGDLLPTEGGADRFLCTILDEILPVIGNLAPLDPARRVLAGHSYGGLFTLNALFTRPDSFSTFVAGSPSIWWQDRAILAREASFRAGTGSGSRLLISVGGTEQTALPGDMPQRAQRRAMARMRDNASEMATRLKESGRITCEFVEFPGENHVSVIPAMLSRAVAFGLCEPKATGRQAA